MLDATLELFVDSIRDSELLAKAKHDLVVAVREFGRWRGAKWLWGLTC